MKLPRKSAWTRRIFFLLLVCFAAPCQAQQADSITYLFAGSYTNGVPADGIVVYRVDPATGRLHKASKVKGIVNPSFLTLSPDGRHLYACTESKLPREGSVTAFAFDPGRGRLHRINQQPSGGQNPVYVRVHPSGRFLLVANYTTPTLALLPIQPDGSLGVATQVEALSGSGPLTERQATAHPHCVEFSPDGAFAFVPDLGSDVFWAFWVDSQQAAIQPRPGESTRARPGSGPRHLVFHPDGRHAYCVEELSGCATALAYHQGQLDTLQRTFAYSNIQPSYGSADIHLSPDGRHLYVSNRWDGENTIACFAVEAGTGLLHLLGHVGTGGDHPRSFCISPDGCFLIVANQESGTIKVFARNAATGLLSPTGQSTRMVLPSTLKIRRYPR